MSYSGKFKPKNYKKYKETQKSSIVHYGNEDS